MPTDIVLLQPGIPVPRPELDDDNWPRVRGYELLTVIGTGGMGIVYMARQCDLHRTVALKMLRGLGQMDSEYRERLRAEAETVAKLQHPNIIQVFEIGTVEPQDGEKYPSPFISFEYVDGGSLMSRTEAPQSPKYAAEIIEKVARAVHAAHRLGVIHRDLKPANVLLTRDGEPKVADFGLAKHFGSEVDSAGRFLTRAGVVMGTPAYMAPEQAAGEEISYSIDIYALGVILYELLTARVPFQGTSPVETMYLVRDQEPVSPRQLQPKLPRDLETICLKCLQKQVGNRYTSADALANDLANWRAGRPILARPVGFVERTLRAARRNPAVAALSIALVLITIVGISGIIWKWQEAQQHADAADTAAKRAEDAAEKAKEATRAERWERYRSHLVAASNALQLNNVVVARQALDTAPEEYRGWEWRYFHQQLDGSSFVFRWPDKIIRQAAFTDDGNAVVIWNTNHFLRILDLKERTEVRTSAPHEFPGRGILSPDRKTFAGFEPDKKEVVLWQLAANKTLRLADHGKRVLMARFSPDSTQIVSASEDGCVRTWDTATGRLLNIVHFGDERPPLGANFSPNVNLMTAGYFSPNKFSLWNLKTKQVHPLNGPEYQNYGAVFSRDSTRLATGSTFPSLKLEVWDVVEFKSLGIATGHTNEMQAYTFNSNNTRLASASMDQTARLWDATNLKPLATMRDHKGWVNDVKFSPDDTRILTASQDQTLRLWNATDGSPVAVLRGHTGNVLKASYLENGSMIGSASSDGTVRLWDPDLVERNGVIRGNGNFVYGVAFHPDNERVASASWDGTVRMWEATTGKQLWASNYGEGQIVVSVAFHPDGKLLASVGRHTHPSAGRGTVRLWDVQTGREVHRWEIPTNWQDCRVAIRPQGDLLAAGNYEGVVRLWDVNTKDEVAQLKVGKSPVRDVTFSPDGKWLAASMWEHVLGVQIWDVAERKLVHTLYGHAQEIYTVAFSPDGKWLASGSTDGTARLWNTTTWKEEAVLKHGANVYSVAFSRDNMRLATACADSTIRFWDVKTHHEIAELRGHEAYVHSIAFCQDGTRLVSGSGDRTLRIWDTVSPQERPQPKSP
ncbi:MAG: protein kinase [Planctomycetes bacterium]|nr:protein kinase [Planctomycetota bacterium]